MRDRVLDPRLRAPDVRAEFLRGLAVHVLVAVAMAADLVPFRGDPPHHGRMGRGDLAEDEERRAGAAVA